VVIWLRAPSTNRGHRGNAKADADIVIDLHDPTWPVIRHVTARLAGHPRWYVTESRAFFATRAATWDTKFGDDLPAYAAAITEAGLSRDSVVIDVGCGTGRALPALRDAVGPRGSVIALDLTPEMLAQARAQGRAEYAALVLAARHGRTLSPDEPLAEAPLRRSMHHAGWQLTGYDDPSIDSSPSPCGTGGKSKALEEVQVACGLDCGFAVAGTEFAVDRAAVCLHGVERHIQLRRDVAL
jgi:SAM-dependent methyltransferase